MRVMDMSTSQEPFIATRWSLISRIRDLDDGASWQDFFDTYWKLIYGVAIRSGLSDTAAQDVVQETVLTVVRNLPQFKTGPQAGSFKAWLLRIVSWRVADQFRKQARNERLIQHDFASAGTSITPLGERVADPGGTILDKVWDEEWEKNLMELALQRVKEKVSARAFQMFDLYALKQWPVAEVARALHTTTAHVYVAKHRVSSALKRELRLLRAQHD